MLKKGLKIIIGFLFISGLFIVWKYKTIKKLVHTVQLFDKEVIVHNFQHMDDTYTVSRLSPSDKPFRYPSKLDYSLIDAFEFHDSVFMVDDFFDYTNTEGLLVIHNDTIVFEQYYRGLTEQTTHISWSMAKSVVSTLAGIARDEGLFSIEDEITKYLPQFAGTGYDGVRIKDILQMSSGVGFNEDYGDFNSDINRFGRAFALGSSFEEFALSMKREREPGTYCHYVSIDTQVIGMLIAKVTGRTLTSYLEEKLWEPLGMESRAEWIIDNEGMELALGGLNMTLRDYAKLGQLYLHNGNFNGTQIVSEKWVHDATTPDAPHLMPGNHGQSSHNLGYGYQWWVPEQDEGDFFAAGIYNQYVYVHPRKNLVIAKLSANHHFKKEGAITKDYHIAMFKRMARDFPDVPGDEKGEL
jgi:CubicO group peptidase (beta-lactamase class C family)